VTAGGGSDIDAGSATGGGDRSVISRSQSSLANSNTSRIASAEDGVSSSIV
jgi:hypothetical protein